METKLVPSPLFPGSSVPEREAELHQIIFDLRAKVEHLTEITKYLPDPRKQ